MGCKQKVKSLVQSISNIIWVRQANFVGPESANETTHLLEAGRKEDYCLSSSFVNSTIAKINVITAIISSIAEPIGATIKVKTDSPNLNQLINDFFIIIKQLNS